MTQTTGIEPRIAALDELPSTLYANKPDRLMQWNSPYQTKFNGGEVNKSVEECMVISELDIELRTTDGKIYNSDSDNSFIFEITERIERIQ